MTVPSEMPPAQNSGSEIALFSYEDADVRSVQVGGEPWFMTADACSILAIRDTSSALKMVDAEDQQRFRRSDTPQFFGGIAPQVQEFTVVNRRCFLVRSIPDGPWEGWSGLMATCPAGMEHDRRMRGGYDHTTAVNPVTMSMRSAS